MAPAFYRLTCTVPSERVGAVLNALSGEATGLILESIGEERHLRRVHRRQYVKNGKTPLDVVTEILAAAKGKEVARDSIVANLMAQGFSRSSYYYPLHTLLKAKKIKQTDDGYRWTSRVRILPGE